MQPIKSIKTLTVSDDYRQWIVELKQRYLSLRLQASIQVNQSLLYYYWSIGRDIATKQYANTYGSAFYKTLSTDMRREMPDVKGFSETNLKYMYYFYELYCQQVENRPRGVDELNQNRPRGVDESPAAILPQPCVEELSGGLQLANDALLTELCSIPWYHQRSIIDKCKENPAKAIFFVHKVLENHWGREVLGTFLKTDLYEREGKAITNFSHTLPAVQSDLAQQLTKDPYNFDFLSIRESFDERELENALVDNITRFLLELGTGFAYMGRQFHLPVGTQEFFPDLLFYNTRLHAYCVVELKVTSFKPEFLGQLGFYVSAINHQLKTEQDNPTIGLLICRNKDNVVAQYALETTNQPIGVSEFELSKIYPSDFKSSMPTIEEIEAAISETMEK